MTWTPRQKAFTFAAVLLLVSSAFVVTAAATTEGALRPFLRGDDYGKERSMSRDHHVALGVRVGQLVDGELQPLVGATVAVAKIGLARPAPSMPPQATDVPGEVGKTLDARATDDKGIVVFELRRGAYQVIVTSGTFAATAKFPVPFSTRVGVIFDEEGNAHWERHPHKAMERRGDMAGLVVRAGEGAEDRPQPIAGAKVQVYKDGSLVQEKATNERGFAPFHITEGTYVVRVTAGGVTGETTITLEKPLSLGALLKDGRFEFKALQAPPHRGDAGDRPARHP